MNTNTKTSIHMSARKMLITTSIIFGTTFGTLSTTAQAVMPVVDAAGLAQAITTVAQLKSQLAQARQLYSSMNGARGLGSIMNNPALRNYLPANWQQVYDNVKNGGYNGLTKTAKLIRNNNKVFDNCAKKTGSTQAICYRQAAQGAQQKDFIGTAITSANRRLVQIEGLMNQINATPDAKAIGELQARIAVEQASISNEMTKLQLFKMMADAEEKLVSQQQRERSAKSTRAVKSSMILK